MSAVTKIKDNFLDLIKNFPDDWELSKNKYAFSKITNGKNMSDTTNVLSLTINGIKVKEDLTFGKTSKSYVGHQLVKEGDLVFTPRDFDQTPILSDVSKHDGCISNLYIVDRPNKEFLPEYINYFWHGLKYSFDYFKNFSYGIRFSFNREQFDDIPLLKPSLIEQKIICTYLDIRLKHIDSLVDKIQRKIDLLKEQRNSLIDQYVTKGLDQNIEMKDSGLELIGEIPKHWKIVKSSHIIDIRDGTHDTPTYVDHGFPLVTQKDIYGGILTFEKTRMISEKDHMKISKRSRVVRNDIIMSMIGSIGYPTLVETDTEFSIKNVCLFKTSTSGQNPKFIKYALESTFVVNQLDLGKGGGVQNFVSLNVLRNLKIILPTKTEQNRIVESLEYKEHQINNLIHSEYRKISLLEEYRHSLISSVVTGKVRVTEDMI